MAGYIVTINTNCYYPQTVAMCRKKAHESGGRRNVNYEVAPWQLCHEFNTKEQADKFFDWFCKIKQERKGI